MTAYKAFGKCGEFQIFWNDSHKSKLHSRQNKNTLNSGNAATIHVSILCLPISSPKLED
jgi:hypothetical protein